MRLHRASNLWQQIKSQGKERVSIIAPPVKRLSDGRFPVTQRSLKGRGVGVSCISNCPTSTHHASLPLL